MDRVQRAKELFLEGKNCSQSIIGANADLIKNIDYDTLMKLALPFGGGMGRLREVCGAVTGMFAVIGLLADNDVTKGEMYQKVQELAKKFCDHTGTIICRELLDGTPVSKGSQPELRTTEYYAKRPCVELIMLAQELLEEEYAKKNIK